MNIKTVLFCSLLLFPFVVNAQKNYSKVQINNLLNDIKFDISINPKQAFLEFNKLYKASLNINHEIGASYSLIGMGHSVGYIGKYKEALSYVNKGRFIAEKLDNDSLLFYADFVTSFQYGRMRLNNKAVSMINNCIKKADVLKDVNNKYFMLGVLYTCKANFSAGLKVKPSIEEFLSLHRKAYFYFSRVNKPFPNPTYNNIGCCFSELNQLDSAIYYFQRGVKHAKIVGKTPEIEFSNLAELYCRKKQSALAIKYLDSSIVICQKENLNYLLAANYEVYKKIHTQLGNKNDALLAQDLVIKYRNIEEIFENNRVAESVNYLLDTTTVENENLLKKHKVFIAISVLLIIVLCVPIRYLYCKRKSLKKESETKDSELQVKSNEIVNLKQKVTTSYSEVIQLAKKDDPLFVSLFKELYPDFYNKLMAINPDLTLTEQKVCFYLKLKFSSKEIADYTYVSIKAIQNRKNRLRKRLFINEREDIYSWIERL